MRLTKVARIIFVVILCLMNYLGKSQNSFLQIDSMNMNHTSNCLLPDSTNIYATCTVYFGNLGDSILFKITFGDGTDTSYKRNVYNFNFTSYYYISVPHKYTSSGSFTPTIKASLMSGMSDSVTLQTFTLSNSCSSVWGKIYLDSNANCIYDNGEYSQPMQLMRAINLQSNDTTYTYSNNNGDYHFSLNAGNYLINPTNTLAIAPANIVCPQNWNVVVVPGNTYYKEFGLDYDSTLYDYYFNFTSYNVTPGQYRNLFLSFQTNSPYFNASNGTLNVILPSQLSYITSNPLPDTILGNVFRWDFDSITNWNQFFVNVLYYCDSAINLGDTFCIPIFLTLSTPDMDSSNNGFTNCVIAGASYDPNEKIVSPKGKGTSGEIPNDTRLTYRINFQNTGTNTAYNIKVKDSLDKDLNLETLQIRGASHPFTVNFENSRELVFSFNNIFLPDSNANEPMSHGYVEYSIKLNDSLADGTKIENTARIYFDYNSPVVTNTTLNTIIHPQSIQTLHHGNLDAIIAPNPANNFVEIAVMNNKKITVDLMDIYGRVLRKANANEKMILQLNDLISGIYLIRIYDNEGNSISSRLLIE